MATPYKPCHGNNLHAMPTTTERWRQPPSHAMPTTSMPCHAMATAHEPCHADNLRATPGRQPPSHAMPTASSEPCRRIPLRNPRRRRRRRAAPPRSTTFTAFPPSDCECASASTLSAQVDELVTAGQKLVPRHHELTQSLHRQFIHLFFLLLIVTLADIGYDDGDLKKLLIVPPSSSIVLPIAASPIMAGSASLTKAAASVS